ncbi:hypothetical protein BH10CYA1_BH10CYA1_46800 [soil metagenome]
MKNHRLRIILGFIACSLCLQAYSCGGNGGNGNSGGTSGTSGTSGAGGTSGPGGTGSTGGTSGTGGAAGNGLPAHGAGSIPLLGSQSDFNETMSPQTTYRAFKNGPAGVRPSYTTNGMAIDIRFRRQVSAKAYASTLGFDTGYVAEFEQ